MKKIILLLSIASFAIAGNCQTIDSANKESKLIEVLLSKPQPRLNQYSSVNLNLTTIIDTIFNSLSPSGKQNVKKIYTNELAIARIETTELGKYTIGAMHFTLNQTNYYTKSLNYEVIDSIPNTDNGLWIRNVKINDSVFCLIIEQRTSHKILNKKDDNPSLSRLEEQKQKARFVPGQFENELVFISSEVGGSVSNLTIDGKEKSISFNETYNYYRIKSREIKMTFTKDNFQNIPEDYDFRNIRIQ